MPIPESEIALAGGNVNAGVVRVGNTVRRQLTAASATIHQLLLHLQKKDFASSPRFLGIDEKGREILSFFEGETGIPTSIWEHDEPLTAVANMLKLYHEATLDFAPAGSAQWAFSYPDPHRHEVICHNDFAPYNFIYQSHIPYAIIDFDLAGPGPRLRDIAYAAYWLVPLAYNSEEMKGFAAADIDNQSRRCRLFCETYGVAITPEFFDMIAEVLSFMGSEAEMRRVVGDVAAQKLKQEGHLAHWQGEAQAFRLARQRLEENLLR